MTKIEFLALYEQWLNKASKETLWFMLALSEKELESAMFPEGQDNFREKAMNKRLGELHAKIVIARDAVEVMIAAESAAPDGEEL